MKPARFDRATRFIALALAGALAGTGCATAGIRRTDGAVLEAEIVDSDAGGIYVRAPGSEQTLRMDGRSVVDIDHPGNVEMLVGGLLLGELGLLMSDNGFRRNLIDGPHGDASAAALPVALLFGVPGALLFGHGTYQYARSKKAASAYERAFEQVLRQPLPSAPPVPPSVASATVPCAATRLATLCAGTDGRASF